jgi:hypothetical protein
MVNFNLQSALVVGSTSMLIAGSGAVAGIGTYMYDDAVKRMQNKYPLLLPIVSGLAVAGGLVLVLSLKFDLLKV